MLEEKIKGKGQTLWKCEGCKRVTIDPNDLAYSGPADGPGGEARRQIVLCPECFPKFQERWAALRKKAFLDGAKTPEERAARMEFQSNVDRMAGVMVGMPLHHIFAAVIAACIEAGRPDLAGTVAGIIQVENQRVAASQNVTQGAANGPKH